jgi:rubrerythrin
MAEAAPKSECSECDTILDPAMAEEQRSRALFGELAERANREEIAAFLERLQTEEAGHLARLQSLLHGLEADRPLVSGWLRSIRRSVPTGSLH